MKPIILSDEELMERIAAKDKRALGILYGRFSALLFGVILRIVSRREEAEDLLQKTWLKIWDYAYQFNPNKGKLATWLINIGRNTAIDYVRSKRHRQKQLTIPIDTPHYNDSKLSEYPATYQEDLNELVYGMEDKYRELIDLIYFEGYTHKEVAEKLNMPLGTVKSRIRTALRKLRNNMKTFV